MILLQSNRKRILGSIVSLNPFANHPTLGTNLTAYYKMEDVNDELGVYNGTVNTGAVSSTSGKIGLCYKSAIETGTGISYSSTLANWGANEPYSYNMWVQSGNLTQSSGILSKGSNDKGTYLWCPGSNKLQLVFESGTSNRLVWETTNAVFTNTTTFNMITVSYNGSGYVSGMTVYVNGIEVSLSTIVDTLGTTSPANTDIFYIGAMSGYGTSYQWNGKIDETGIWNKALTQSEVTSLYNDGLGLSYDGSTATLHFGEHPTLGTDLTAYYKMEDVNDSHTGGYTATLNSGTVGSVNGKIGKTWNSVATTHYGLQVPANVWYPGANEPFSLGGWYYKGNSTAYKVYWGAMTNSRTEIYDETGTGYVVMNLKNVAGQGITVAWTGTPVPLTTWTHLLWTYSGSGLASGVKMYVNGVEWTARFTALDTLGSNLPISTPTTSNIGAYTANSGQYAWYGSVDEFGFWSKELSNSEASALYNGGLGLSYDGSAGTPFVNHATLGTGITSYYKLDETSGTTVADIAGGFTGTVNTGATLSTAGKINTGVSWTTATGKGIQTNDTFKFASNVPFTINFWVKLTTTGVWQNLISRINKPDGVGVPGGYIATDGSNKIYWKIGSGREITGVTTTKSLNTSWNMVTFAYDGTGTSAGLKLYVNASAETAMTIWNDAGTYTDYTPNTPFEIGGYGDTSTQRLRGVEDEFGIWNKALTQTEVTALYNSGTGLTY